MFKDAAIFVFTSLPLAIYLVVAVIKGRMERARRYTKATANSTPQKDGIHIAAKVSVVAHPSVKRGDQSLHKFGLAYAGVSGFYLFLISIMDAFHGYKVAISVLVILTIFYLFFLNAWSRNNVLKLVNKIKELES